MPFKARKALLTGASILLTGAVASAQPRPDPAPAQEPPNAPHAAPVRTPAPVAARPLSDSEAQALRQALESARRGDVNGARAAASALTDPLARKVAAWALVDSAAESLSFFEVEQARRDLVGWPREARRRAAAERLLGESPFGPQQIIDWFAGAEPQTAEGAMALASAYRAVGRPQEAATLIRSFWRDKLFEAEPQRAMLARFGDVLTPADHIRRADILLYGPQGPAARDAVALLPADHRALSEARMAFRADAANANALAAAVPAHLADHPGLVFERASYLRRRGMDTAALGLVRGFPNEIPFDDAGKRIWGERYRLILSAIRNGDAQGAYAAAANSGLSGGHGADAEFYAGWLALTRLNNPALADTHFAALEQIGSSPITQGRALYWRGRAAEARGDAAAAQRFFEASAQHNTTFYGQLAGERVGDGRLTLAADPEITAADRARFHGREPVRAAKLLLDAGESNLFRVFVASLGETLPTAEEHALLIDMARAVGQDTAMRAARKAAQRGFVLADRAYPYRAPPQIYDGPEPALVLGVTRQESGFDPLVRSHVGARGMMQLMPATAELTARKMGVSYSPSMLDDPEYNMRLGSTYLAQMIDRFSGSYIMAAAGYNAGPGRPAQWVSFCGDPRTASVDPIDFIECIPFSETRNYVMRVMEGMQVYRAKQHGGSVPITLSSDLARGSYGYPQGSQVTAALP